MIELYTAPNTPNGHKISIALAEVKKNSTEDDSKIIISLYTWKVSKIRLQ